MDAAKTVRIVYPANLRCGYCQIPEAEYDPSVHTLWREPGAAHDDLPSDDEMRAFIAEKTGKAPHHKTGHAKLVEIYLSLSLGDA